MAAPKDHQTQLLGEHKTFDISQENHAKKILHALNQNRKSRTFCDGIVTIDNVTIPVQRCILAATSHYFKLAFERNTSTQLLCTEEKVTVSVDITPLGISTNTFEAILDYIYTSYIQLHEENIQDILQAADLLLLLDLKNKCCEFLESCISCHNCLGIFEFSQQYTCPWVHYKASTFLDENFGEIVHNDEFLQLPAGRLKSILQRDSLHVTSEVQVLQAVLLWMKVEKETGKEMLIDIVKECLRPANICYNKFIGMMRAYISDEDSSYKALAAYIATISDQQGEPRGVENVLLLTGGIDLYDHVDKQIVPDVTCYISRRSEDMMYNIVEKQQKETILQFPPMLVPRIGHSAVECGGCLYVVGGESNNDLALNNAEKYDPVTNKWYEIAAMNQARHHFLLVAVDYKIYAIGGMCDTEILSSMEMYDVYKNKWCKCPDVKLKREMACAAVVDKKIYVIGGNNLGRYLDAVECYDTRNEIWSTVTPMLERRSNAKAVAIGGNIFVLGGFRPTNCPSNFGALKFCQNEVFSARDNKWSPIHRVPIENDMCDMSNQNDIHDAVHHGNEIWVIGDIQTRGSYCHIRAMDLDTGRWHTVTARHPSFMNSYSSCTLRVPKRLLQNMQITD